MHAGAEGNGFDIRNGQVWCWGLNTNNSLGLGYNGPSPYTVHSPTLMVPDSNWVSITSGTSDDRTMGIKSDGTSWAWGMSYTGSCGLGYPNLIYTLYVPTQVGSDNDWAQIATGIEFSVGLKSNGTLWVCGGSGWGELGIGNVANQGYFVPLDSAHDWVCVKTGKGHTLALKANGTLWAWGLNGDGQLGIGSYVNQYYPVQVGTDHDWISVSTREDYSMALKANGTLWAWGLNNYGQLGIGNTTLQTTPVQVGTDSDWAVLGAGVYHSMALKSNGTLWAWGLNSYGQLGIGNTIDQSSPIQVGSEKWVDISTGYYYSFGLQSNGQMWGWGHNLHYELGMGNNIEQHTPVPISIQSTEWVMAATGAHYSIALYSDGTLWAWGSNEVGQLGTGNTTDEQLPVQTGNGDNKWIIVTAGTDHTMAIKSDGTLWGWGNNAQGELGIGNIINQHSPVQVGAQNDWISVRTGHNYTVALRSNGTLWVWGANDHGQLGTGNLTQYNSPVQVNGTNWIAAEVGGYHTVALKADGTMWSWGWNNNGQLGIGNLVEQHSPSLIGADTTWTTVACGNLHTTARKADGSIWAWGANADGELGIGNNTDQTSPVQTGTGTEWIGIAAGNAHTFAYKADGTISSYGQNISGQLGLGNNTNQNAPMQIAEPNIIQAFWGPVNQHSAIINVQRRLICVTGLNNFGQLGDGTLIDKNLFNCINECGMPSISITATPGDTLCSSTTATFTATVANGGPGPVFTWIKNNVIVGNGPTYTDINLNTGDIIYCALISNAGCQAPGQTADTSNIDTMVLLANTSPTVNITVNPGTNINVNQSVTFTANVTNGGPSPSYQWRRNGNNIPGATLQTYTTTAIQDNDSISCRVNGTTRCIDTGESNKIVMHVANLGLSGTWAADIHVKVFPNPTNDLLYIDYSNITQGTIEILDLAGRVLMKQTLKHSLDIHALESGIYMYRISSNGLACAQGKLAKE